MNKSNAIQKEETKFTRFNPFSQEPEVLCYPCNWWAPSEECCYVQGEWYCEECLEKGK